MKIEEQMKAWLDTEEKREQNRIEREEKHEERMFMMFSSFMGQIMQMQMIPHAGSHMSSLHDYGPSPVITAIMHHIQLPARLFPDLLTTVKHMKVIQVIYEVVMHSSNSVLTNWSHSVCACVFYCH